MKNIKHIGGIFLKLNKEGYMNSLKEIFDNIF